MQLLIHRASALPLLEDEQKFKLGGVLTAIISHFDRQLLGNEMSFIPCSIHILLISNKFHKFWMSCAFRRQYTKNVPKLGKTQAGRPGTSTHCDMSLIQEWSDILTLPLNHGFQVGLIKWTERPSTWIEGPTCSTYRDFFGPEHHYGLHCDNPCFWGQESFS